jgi:hypothetical protein
MNKNHKVKVYSIKNLPDHNHSKSKRIYPNYYKKTKQLNKTIEIKIKTQE